MRPRTTRRGDTRLTATDGATTFQPRPAEGPLPEMLASLEAEFFVEWQVAELTLSVQTPDR